VRCFHPQLCCGAAQVELARTFGSIMSHVLAGADPYGSYGHLVNRIWMLDNCPIAAERRQRRQCRVVLTHIKVLKSSLLLLIVRRLALGALRGTLSRTSATDGMVTVSVAQVSTPGLGHAVSIIQQSLMPY